MITTLIILQQFSIYIGLALLIIGIIKCLNDDGLKTYNYFGLGIEPISVIFMLSFACFAVHEVSSILLKMG